MTLNQNLHLAIRRLLIVLTISLVFVFAMGEIAHYFLKEDYDRSPQVVELVIPAGTAEKVAVGEADPAIPEEMVFVVGDVLVVQNDDTVAHQLGPILVPPGTRASLRMEDANKYAYSCSFQPSRYLGLNVRQGTTLSIRLIALAYVTPATAVILFVYSLVLYPLRHLGNQSLVSNQQ